MNLDDLASFAAVAEARSFRGAAYVRGVAASSLSDAVRRLERELDVRLLHRTTRSVTPTAAGQRLLERLTPALCEVRGALDAINAEGESPVGSLRLNVPTIVARVLLPPLIGPFLARHPGIRLEVVAEDRLIDVLAAGFDAGVRYDEHLEADMISVRLGPVTQRFAVAATPACELVIYMALKERRRKKAGENGRARIGAGLPGIREPKAGPNRRSLRNWQFR